MKVLRISHIDRYPTTTIKGATRSNRAGKNASCEYILLLHTSLPAQKVFLSDTHNKMQLISLIRQYYYMVDHLVDTHNEMVITPSSCVNQKWQPREMICIKCTRSL